VGRLSGVPELIGKAGWLRAFKAVMPTEITDRAEIIVVAQTDDGELINSKVGDRLLMSPARSLGDFTGEIPNPRLDALQSEAFDEFVDRVRQENYAWLMEEEERLSRFAKDTEIEIEAKIATLDAEIKELNRSRLSPLLAMQEKVAIMRDIRKKESERDELKMSQFEAKRKVNKQINERLDDMAALLDQQPRAEPLFTLRFQVA
jgi:hypothetical protein